MLLVRQWTMGGYSRREVVITTGELKVMHPSQYCNASRRTTMLFFSEVDPDRDPCQLKIRTQLVLQVVPVRHFDIIGKITEESK